MMSRNGIVLTGYIPVNILMHPPIKSMNSLQNIEFDQRQILSSSQINRIDSLASAKFFVRNGFSTSHSQIFNAVNQSSPMNCEAVRNCDFGPNIARRCSFMHESDNSSLFSVQRD